MSVIGRLIPSLESQVNLKNFRGISTPDALYRMSGVRIGGLLGSMTSIYGFAIDIFEDIQKEIDDINKKLNNVENHAKNLVNPIIKKKKKRMMKKRIKKLLKKKPKKKKKQKKKRKKELKY